MWVGLLILWQLNQIRRENILNQLKHYLLKQLHLVLQFLRLLHNSEGWGLSTESRAPNQPFKERPNLETGLILGLFTLLNLTIPFPNIRHHPPLNIKGGEAFLLFLFGARTQPKIWTFKGILLVIVISNSLINWKIKISFLFGNIF